MRRERLCFIATEWGATEGGINVLNMRLAIAAAARADVCCLVFKEPTESAPNLTLRYVDITGRALEQIVEAIRAAVAIGPDWWIGHDVHTGQFANACRRGLELSCVINHMDYLSYKPYERDPEAIAKSDAQATILHGADLVAAVGPKLYRTVRDLAPHVRKIQIVPGCEEFAEAIGVVLLGQAAVGGPHLVGARGGRDHLRARKRAASSDNAIPASNNNPMRTMDA